MRKSVILLIVGTLIMGSLGAPAMSAKKKKKRPPPPPPPPPVEQVVEGQVRFPAVTFDQANNRPACFAGVHRRLRQQFGDTAQGNFGYDFDIDPATWGGTFVLEPPAGADFDITFYEDFGTATSNPVGQTVTFETRGTAPEEGEIPADMKKAIVCLFSTGSVPTAFKYKGTGPILGVAPSPSPSPSA